MSSSALPDDTAYLPASGAEGCPYCLNPDSAAVRRTLSQPAGAAATLVTADLAEDVAWLHRLMQRHYAAYIDLLRHPSFDVEAFFADWQATVERAIGRIPLREALIEPLVRLQQAVPDHHLLFPVVRAALATDARVTVHEYQAVVDGPEKGGVDAAGIPGACVATGRIAPMLRVDGRLVTVATVSAQGPGQTREVRFGASVLPLDRRSRSASARASADLPPYQWRMLHGVAVLTLRRFAGGAAVRDELRRFVADYAWHASLPRILFDLRGNGGGSLEYVQQWLARALGGEVRRQPLLDLAPCLCGDWNRMIEAQVRAATVDTPEAREERSHLRDRWSQSSGVARLRLHTPISRCPVGPPYAGRVFVMVDHGTGSSGELAAWELKRNLDAVLLGERSAGCMQYGQACRFVLPRTGLVCQLPTRRFFYDEKVESVGLRVDAYLEDARQDADTVVGHLEAVESALQTLAGGRRE